MQVSKPKSNVVIVGNLKGGDVFRRISDNLVLMVINGEEKKYVDLEGGLYYHVEPTASVEYFSSAHVKLEY